MSRLATGERLSGGLVALLAVAAAAGVANPPPFAVLAESGGLAVLGFNLALLVLAAALGALALALGDVALLALRSAGALQLSAEAVLLRLTLGTALLSVLGVALAAARLIDPWVSGAILAAALGSWIAWRGALVRDGLGRLRQWLSPKAPAEASPLLRILRWLGILAAAALLLLRTIDPHLGDFDSQQQYVLFLDEVRHLGSFWLDPAEPLYFDFLSGRGNGVFLFAAGIGGGLVIQAVSAVYAVLILLTLRAVAVRALAPAEAMLGPAIPRLLPDLAVILAATILSDVLPFGRYHVQTAAWFLAALYAVVLRATGSEGERRLGAVLLAALAVALPLSLPQYTAIYVAIVAVGVLCGKIAGRPLRDPASALAVLGAGVMCAAGLLFNWLYIGTPELIPYWVFEPFIRDGVFSRWSSRQTQLYVNYLQGVTGTFATAAPAELHLSLAARVAEALRALLGGPGVAVAVLALAFAGAAAMGRLGKPVGQLAIALRTLLLALALAFLAAGPPAVSRMRYLALDVLVRALEAGALAAGLALLLAGCRPPTPRAGLRAAAAILAALLAYHGLASGLPALINASSLMRLFRHQDAVLPVTAAIALALAALLALVPGGAQPSPVRRRLAWLAATTAACAGAILAAYEARTMLWGGWQLAGAAALATLLGAALLGAGLVAAWGRLSRQAAAGTLPAPIRSGLLEAAAAATAVFVVLSLASIGRAESIAALLRYAAGLGGAEAALPPAEQEYGRCLRLAEVLPAHARLLHINGFSTLAPCVGAGIFPRGTLQHPYESALARAFRETVLSGPDEAERTLRGLGIDYFLVDKGDIHFWGAGLDPLFQPPLLGERFALFAETPDFYVLAWKGHGKRALSSAEASAIVRLEHLSQQESGFIRDGYHVSHWQAAYWLGMPRPAYHWGDTIDFRTGGNSGEAIERGWSSPDEGGTWTDGDAASLLLAPASSTSAPVLLTLESQAFTPPQQPFISVGVAVNGVAVAHWLFLAGEPLRPRTALIPAGLAARSPELRIVLTPDHPASPASYGLSRDDRQLGLHVASLRLEPGAAPPPPPLYRLGERLDFGSAGNVRPYLGDGWWGSESAGTWSAGPRAELGLRLATKPSGDLKLLLDGHGLLAPAQPSLTVEVEANGTAVGRISFDAAAPGGERAVSIPGGLLGEDGELRLSLLSSPWHSPAELGLSADRRPLGLFVRSLVLEAE